MPVTALLLITIMFLKLAVSGVRNWSSVLDSIFKLFIVADCLEHQYI